jgi:hypothetical protein
MRGRALDTGVRPACVDQLHLAISISGCMLLLAAKWIKADYLKEYFSSKETMTICSVEQIMTAKVLFT